jgi:hypothetical protein
LCPRDSSGLLEYLGVELVDRLEVDNLGHEVSVVFLRGDRASAIPYWAVDISVLSPRI